MELIQSNISLTKSESENIATSVVQKIKDGYMSNYEGVALAKFLEETAKKIRLATVEGAVDELTKEGASGLTYKGAKIQVKESGVKYEYPNSPMVAEIDQEIKNLKEIQKEVQDFAKVINTPSSFTSSFTGEISIVYPAIKKSTTTVNVTLSKD